MKRPITNLVIGCLLFFVSQLTAQPVSFTLTPQTVNGNPGDMISVDVVVTNFNNILSFQYSMNWDPAVVQFVSITDLSAQLPGFTSANFGTNNAGNGVITTSWLDPDVTGVSLPNGTNLYQLNFSVLSTNETTISFGNTPTPIEFVNGGGNTVNFTPGNAIVNEGGGNGGGGGGDLVISGETLTAASGSNVCVAVTAENFEDVVSMQFSINYNTAILTYTGVQSFGLPGLTAGNFNSQPANSSISVSWDDPNSTGVTVPDGTTLFEVCFNVIGTNGQSSSVSFTGNPTSIEIIDGNSANVPHTFENGSVAVSGGTPPPVQGFALIASDETVSPGGTFCMDVTSNDFNNIISMQFSMGWEESLFEYTGVQNFGLPGLSGGNFGSTQVNNGVLTFSWDDPNSLGVTVPNGTVLFQVCFEAIGPMNCNSSSQFFFGGTPLLIEVVNGNGQNVTWQGVPGDLTICNGPPPASVTFIGSQETAGNGSQVCVDVSVENFTCIVSAQFSIHYNTSVLQYTSVQGFGLPGLVPGNFNAQPANGVILFSWDDPNSTGVTVTDGSVIFQVCFNVIGSQGQTSNITFDGNPTSVEVVNCNNQTLTPNFTSGLVTVGNPCPGPVVIAANPIITHVTCHNGGNGTIDITVTGGNGSFTYKWTDEDGVVVGMNSDLTGVGAGTYTIMVTSCNGAQTATATYTISQPETPLNVQFQVMNVACFGEMTGTIDLTVTGGTFSTANCNGYTYKWSDNASITTQDRSGLAPGAYTVTVTDCNGCQDIKTINIAGPPSALNATFTQTNVTCFGQCNGSITVNATGGVAPYMYKLNNGQFVNNATFPNLCAGTYTIMVKDGLGCTKSFNTTVGTPQPIAYTATVNQATNGCNGSITNSNTTGGVPPYTYLWTNGATTPVPPGMGLCAGDYTVTVTDANQCTKTFTFTIISPMTVTVSDTKNACFGVCDGSISLNVVGGSNPTYQWSPAITGNPEDPTGLCAGTYNVTVTSTDGQTKTVTGIQITQASSPIQINTILNQGVSSPTAFDGALTVNATGSFGGFTYSWNAGSGPSLTNLPVGSYTVTVTDSETCTNTKTEEIVYDPSALTLILTTTNSCLSPANGTLSINVNGGIGPYDLVVTGPGYNETFEDVANGIFTIEDLPAGTYTVVATDSAPGTFQQTITKSKDVLETVMAIDPIAIFPSTNGNSNGKIDVTPSGGSQPYTYTWNNGSFAQDPNNLEEGCYQLTMGEASGCYQVFPEICVFDFSASSVTDKPECSDDFGSITVTPSSLENAPFTYLWTSNGQPIGTGDSILADVAPGTYTVKITDALGVSITQMFTLTANSNLTGDVIATSNFNGFNIRCFSGTSGTAMATAQNGFGDTYSYLWSNGATEQSVSGLSAGLAKVTITDGIGCSVVDSVDLFQPTQLTVETESDRNGCTEDAGLSTASVFGGVQPYSYLWNDPLKQTGKTATFLEGGTYQVNVNDGNGCTAIGTSEVAEYVPLELEVLSEPDEGGPSGKAIVLVVSGTGPFEYQWQNYPTEADSVLSELLPGTYMVVVTDANECQEFKSIEVRDATQCGEVLTLITPEGDGYNEFFEIACLSRFSDNTLEIYNRWGQLVREYDNYNEGDLWNGTDNRGNSVDDGVYFYVFDYLDPVANQRITKKGSVTVLRK